jgi:hypothetical protein
MDFSLVDSPDILRFIFYPRPDLTPTAPSYCQDRFIPVEEDVLISCRFYSKARTLPTILLFHGNGEIASDYDDIAPLFLGRGVNLMIADYRGYGRSQGIPTFSNTLKDAPIIFEGVNDILKQEGYTLSLYVMGRSLGSISSTEIAHRYPQRVKGLILESGFADPGSLLYHLLGITLEQDFPQISNVAKIRSISIPTLIIHAQNDSLIPVSEAWKLYESSKASQKRILLIPRADHNTIFWVGASDYLKAIEEFVAC